MAAAEVWGVRLEGSDVLDQGACTLGPDGQLPEPGRDGSTEEIRSEEFADQSDHTHEVPDGDRNPGSVGNLEDLDPTMRVDRDAIAQSAEDLPEFESTPGDSDPKSRPSSECEGWYSSDNTSELSEGERLAFELRRAEIRRGKAREVSPVPSEAAHAVAVPGTLSGQLRGAARDEALLPAAGPAPDPDDTDVVYIPWEKDPGRPLQKLPIRFRDLNGRTYLLPWKTVKTWSRAQSLIKRIHEHQPRVLDIINDGEYHLIAKNAWANENDAAIGPSLVSYPQPPTLDQHSLPGSSNNHPLGPPTNPMTGGRNRIPQTRDAIVLPETWDVVVEPGMYVDMVAWHSGPHPVFGLVPPQQGHGRGWAIPPPPPPPPPHIAHVLDDEGMPHYSLSASQANQAMALATGGWPPRPAGRGRMVSVAPRRVVRTRVRQKR